jgi:hypothetical protein
MNGDEGVSDYPQSLLFRGGWFAIQEEGQLGSGPWRSKEAADAALVGDFDTAHKLDKEPRR